MRFKKRIVGGLALLPLVGLLSLTGNSGVMAALSEETLAATGTEDDHLVAARLYQNKEQALEAEAIEFRTAASKIGQYEDTKGFRREALTMAAQKKEADARKMQALYATHMRQANLLANVLLGKVQPQ